MWWFMCVNRESCVFSVCAGCMAFWCYPVFNCVTAKDHGECLCLPLLECWGFIPPITMAMRVSTRLTYGIEVQGLSAISLSYLVFELYGASPQSSSCDLKWTCDKKSSWMNPFSNVWYAKYCSVQNNNLRLLKAKYSSLIVFSPNNHW